MRRLSVIASFFLIITLSFIITSSHATEYNAMSIEVDTWTNLVLKGIDAGDEKYDFFLNRYYNAQDSSSYYWKLEYYTPSFQASHVNIAHFQYSQKEPLDRHNLDIYYPDNPENDKVLIFVPGGGWQRGDKELYGDLGNTLAGIYHLTVVIINYRLSNDEDGNAVHPDHVEDVASAFSWVKANISPYGSSDAIYLFGQSAGAHLVSLLATDDKYIKAAGCSISDIRGVISMSGVYNLPDFVKYPGNPLELDKQSIVMYKKLMADAFGGWDEAQLSDPSPVTHINPSRPPFLVIYTYNDLPGFSQDAENFAKAVRALSPAPEIVLRKIEFSDYSDSVWQAAEDLASQEPAMAEYVGHYAEVMEINPHEQDNYVTRLIVDFIRGH